MSQTNGLKNLKNGKSSKSRGSISHNLIMRTFSLDPNSSTKALEVTSGILNGNNQVDTSDFFQLKGIFLSVDDDEDGFISRIELIDCLKFLGIDPKEKLVEKYLKTAYLKTAKTGENERKGLDGEENYEDTFRERVEEDTARSKQAWRDAKVDFETFLDFAKEEISRSRSILKRDIAAVSERVQGGTIMQPNTVRKLLSFSDDRLRSEEIDRFVGMASLAKPQSKTESKGISSMEFAALLSP